MGQAKQRGSFEERRNQALDRKAESLEFWKAGERNPQPAFFRRPRHRKAASLAIIAAALAVGLNQKALK